MSKNNFEANHRETENVLGGPHNISAELAGLKMEVENDKTFINSLEAGRLEDPEKMKRLLSELFNFHADYLGLITQRINEKNNPPKHSRDFVIPWGAQDDVKRAIAQSIEVIIEKLTGTLVKIPKSLHDSMIKIIKELFNEKGAQLDASHSKTTGLREAFLQNFPVVSHEEITQRERDREEEKRKSIEEKQQAELEKKQREEAVARAQADSIENTHEAEEASRSPEEELYKDFLKQELANWKKKKTKAQEKIEKEDEKLASTKREDKRKKIEKNKEEWRGELEMAQREIDRIGKILKDGYQYVKPEPTQLSMEEESIVETPLLGVEDITKNELDQLVNAAIEEQDPIKKQMYSFEMFPDSKFSQIPFSPPTRGEKLSVEELEYRYKALKQLYGEGAKVLNREMKTGVCEEGIVLLKTYDPNEKLVDIGGFSENYPDIKRKLRAGAYNGLLLAQQFAALFGLELSAESAFRSIRYQTFLKENERKRNAELGIETKNDNLAEGGESDHNEGAGIDITAYLKGTNVKCTPGPNDRDKSQYEQIYSDILILCMNMAGWTWFPGEKWHFSYGTKDSNYVLKKMEIVKRGDVNRRAYGLAEKQ